MPYLAVDEEAAVFTNDPSNTTILRPRRPRTPALALCEAILHQAITDLRYAHARGDHTTMIRARALADDARRWFASDADSHVFFFIPICDRLGLDPTCVRRAVLGAASVTRRGGLMDHAGLDRVQPGQEPEPDRTDDPGRSRV
jgi:hypothetical protein